jgi:hypothetical protein
VGTGFIHRTPSICNDKGGHNNKNKRNTTKISRHVSILETDESRSTTVSDPPIHIRRKRLRSLALITIFCYLMLGMYIADHSGRAVKT